MDFSNMILRPALDRITSSFASTTTTSSYYGGFLTRMLSFTSSFNDRTSLLQEHNADADADADLGRITTQTQLITENAAAAAPPPPPAEPVLAAAAAALVAASSSTAADHPFDIEAGTTTTPLAREEGPPAAATDEDENEAESKRVGKSVQPVCLFVASASLVLFANLPSNKQQSGPGAAAEQHGLLYIADMAFISLGFFCSLGLSMFSVMARPGSGGEEAAAVASRARVQKRGMVVAVASVVVAFSLRVCMMLAVA